MSQGEWRPDPSGKFEYRWWDGAQWTEQVARGGDTFVDPVPGQGDDAATQGESGQVTSEPGSTAAQPQPAQAQTISGQDSQAQTMPAHTMPARAMQGQAGQGHGGGRFPGITGDLVDGRFAEREAEPIANQNSKMLRVRLGEPFMARQGSMVAYQGNVDFNFEGGGVGKFLKKMATGEGVPLMKVTGRGDVFLAEQATDVHLLHLNNAGLSISGKNVLGFSASLQWDIERIKGGSMIAGGLFNTTLRGTGWCAITTDGPPVVLNAAEAPTFTDADALVAWSANLQTSIKSSFKASALIGRGSGEMFQVAFGGQGFVIVQPSEGQYYPTPA